MLFHSHISISLPSKKKKITKKSWKIFEEKKNIQRNQIQWLVAYLSTALIKNVLANFVSAFL